MTSKPFNRYDIVRHREYTEEGDLVVLGVMYKKKRCTVLCINEKGISVWYSSDELRKVANVAC